MTVFACVNFWWQWLMWGSAASAWHCWCVWRLSLSADRQCSNMSGIILTHQPSDCMTSVLLALPQDNPSSIYTEQVKIKILSSTILHSQSISYSSRWLHPFFLFFLLFFLFAPAGRQLNIAHISIKPLCSIKFKAIIHCMPEIAVLTVPVPVNQNSDEREV